MVTENMSETFLPEGEEIPQGVGRYMKFDEGDNQFRILSSAVTGWGLWIDGKPIRKMGRNAEFSKEDLENADINKFTGKRKTPQYFWAFPVWNYKTEQVEILEVTQKGVLNGIQDYLNDSDYGAQPWKYDLIVVRDESNDRVDYRVKAKPPKDMPVEASEAFSNTTIDLNALFTGDNPFASTEQQSTDGLIELTAENVETPVSAGKAYNEEKEQAMNVANDTRDKWENDDVTPDQIKMIHKQGLRNGMDHEKVSLYAQENYEVGGVDKLSKGQASDLITELMDMANDKSKDAADINF